MKINKHLTVKKEQLPGHDNILIIDNFLAEPLNLSEKTFESNTQLMPFPLGKREKVDVNIPQLHKILDEHLDVKTNKIDAEYVLTTWNDINSYESTAWDDIFELEHPNTVNMVMEGDSYPQPGANMEGKYIDDIGEEGKLQLFDIMKEKGVNNHPARPVWDKNRRYHAILFLADHDKIQKHNYKRIVWESPFPFTFFSSRHETISTYWWEDTNYNYMDHFYYYLYFRYHEWYKAASTTAGLARPAEENFHIEHALVDYQISHTVDNIYNRLLIFPGWYYHAYQLQRSCFLDQLTLNMILE